MFFAEDFIGPFQSFLITLGVPLAAWAGIMIADIALRKRDYDDEDLFDARGRYGAFDWVSIGTMVVASVIGWGLVVNSFAQDARGTTGRATSSSRSGSARTSPRARAPPYWEGNWPYSNIGVLLALALGFLVTLVARRRHGAPPGGAGADAVAAAARHPRAGPVTDPVRGWLVVVDPQAVFADPGHLAVGLPDVGVHRAAHRRARGEPSAVPRTVLTRFVADPSLGGSWGDYEEWPFALVPDDDPLYAVVPELRDAATTS